MKARSTSHWKEKQAAFEKIVAETALSMTCPRKGEENKIIGNILKILTSSSLFLTSLVSKIGLGSAVRV